MRKEVIMMEFAGDIGIAGLNNIVQWNYRSFPWAIKEVKVVQVIE